MLRGAYLADLTQASLQGEYVCVEGWSLPNNQGQRSACGYDSYWRPVEPLEIQLYGGPHPNAHPHPHLSLSLSLSLTLTLALALAPALTLSLSLSLSLSL